MNQCKKSARCKGTVGTEETLNEYRRLLLDSGVIGGNSAITYTILEVMRPRGKDKLFLLKSNVKEKREHSNNLDQT